MDYSLNFTVLRVRMEYWHLVQKLLTASLYYSIVAGLQRYVAYFHIHGEYKLVLELCYSHWHLCYFRVEGLSLDNQLHQWKVAGYYFSIRWIGNNCFRIVVRSRPMEWLETVKCTYIRMCRDDCLPSPTFFSVFLSLKLVLVWWYESY